MVCVCGGVGVGEWGVGGGDQDTKHKPRPWMGGWAQKPEAEKALETSRER